METDSIHDLSAAYALDALEAGERRAFEEHLGGCERCREEVAAYSVAAEALAYAAGPAEPSPMIRDRILVAARVERPNVVPLRPRWVYPVAAVAAVAACAAIGLGIWNVSLSNRLSNTQALQSISVSGAPGKLVVGSNGAAALVLYRLDAAPAGKTYEAWVIRGKRAPVPAGLFRGGGNTFVPIDGKVRTGSVVAVTVEPSGGSTAPTTKPFAVSSPV
jgi:anti-sigma-K factor RskA